MSPAAERLVECRASLQPHPGDAAGPVGSIEVEMCRTPAAALELTYRLRGDLSRVCVPAPAGRRIVERLWEHTCCELFLRARGGEAYHEFNFSPSGEWAAYAFERYREGGLLTDVELDPRVRMSSISSLLELRATVTLARLSHAYTGAPLALGVSAIVEADDGKRTYWALAHPAEKPDFHHSGAFALTIDAVRN
jgi:hypothetical protein